MDKVHTPTPWEIRFLTGTDIEIRGPGYGQICKFSGLSHSTELMDDYGPTEKANAEFIVEACNNHYSLTSELKELKEWKLEAEGKLIEVAQAAGILSNENDSLKAELKAKEEEIERQIGEYLVLGAKLVKANEELTRLKSDPELLRGSIGVELVRQNLELKDLLKEIIEKCDGVSNPPCYIDSILFNKIDSALSKHQPIKKDETEGNN